MYPMGLRQNNNTSRYSNIANKHYYETRKRYDTIEQLEFEYCKESHITLLRMQESLMITTVFSAMALEAFFTDYAAASLGDDNFYNSFDRLNVIGKFDLIASYILRTNIDKSKVYYSLLKTLIKRRDDLVHSKSKEFEPHGSNECNLEELSEIEESPEYHDECRAENKRRAKTILREAKDCLRTLKEIAVFFIEHDSDPLPLATFFPACYAFCVEPYPVDLRTIITNDIGLKCIEANSK